MARYDQFTLLKRRTVNQIMDLNLSILKLLSVCFRIVFGQKHVLFLVGDDKFGFPIVCSWHFRRMPSESRAFMCHISIDIHFEIRVLSMSHSMGLADLCLQQGIWNYHYSTIINLDISWQEWAFEIILNCSIRRCAIVLIISGTTCAIAWVRRL